MALVKDGNVYFIVDTDEIPILDVNLIDEAYSKVANNGETVAMFKRKKVAHKYLRGYIGFHLWKTDVLIKSVKVRISISGTNSEIMKITPKTKMDKMSVLDVYLYFIKKIQNSLTSKILWKYARC